MVRNINTLTIPDAREAYDTFVRAHMRSALGDYISLCNLNQLNDAELRMVKVARIEAHHAWGQYSVLCVATSALDNLDVFLDNYVALDEVVAIEYDLSAQPVR